jgi:SAM-dependent methyltransferase
MARGILVVIAACACASAARAQDADLRAPFVTTPEDVVERMLVLAGTGPKDLVVDLGSGDGRIVIAAARRFGARGLGIDYDARLVARSRENARAAGVADKVRFVDDDALQADISQATIVTVYLLPELLWKLQPRFISELQPGTRIVSHAFHMAGWAPDREETLRVTSPHPGQGATSTLYLWIVPANVRGTWRSGEEQIRIAQNYQEIEVEGANRASLRGREISWESARGRFRGTAEGDRIVGRMEEGAVSRARAVSRVP